MVPRWIQGFPGPYLYQKVPYLCCTGNRWTQSHGPDTGKPALPYEKSKKSRLRACFRQPTLNRHVVSMKGTKGDFRVEPDWEEIPPDSLSLCGHSHHFRIFGIEPGHGACTAWPLFTVSLFVPDALDPHGLWPSFRCASVLWFLSSRKNKLCAM